MKAFKKTELLYLAALTIYVAVALFQATYLYNVLNAQMPAIATVMKLMRYAAYLCCIIRLTMMGTTTVIKIVICAGLLMTAALLSLKGTDKSPLFYMLMIIGAYDIDFDRILKVFAGLQILTMAFCLICCFFLGIGDESVMQNGRERYFLGFGWVNRFPYLWLGLFLETVCLRHGKIRLWELGIFSVVAALLFMKTKTVFPFAATGGAIVVFGGRRAFRWDRKDGIGRKTPWYELLAFPAMAVVGIGLCKFYNGGNSLLYALNRFVDYRLSLGHSAIDKYGLGLFGNDTVWTGASTLIWNLTDSLTYEYVDCSYLQIALDYGLLMLGIVIVIYAAGILFANRRGRREIVLAVLLFGALSIFEPRLIDFTMNPFILYGASAFTAWKVTGKGRKICIG